MSGIKREIKREFDLTPCNKNATKEARELLLYLGNTVKEGKILTGQHTQTKPQEEKVYIEEKTGKSPKVVGFEMLSYSRNIDYVNSGEACLTEVYENRGTIDTAIELAKKSDIIVTICFHWFSPVGGSDKAFYSEHTDFDPEKVFVSGSAEETAFFQDLDVIAEELKRFQDLKIPVLWRPFHEGEGTWFWWGRKGAEIVRRLYILMYHYFTDNKKLNNLLWVWSTPVEGSYPGDEYCDVIGWDIYLPEKKATDYRDFYEKLSKNLTDGKIHALTEIGYLPDVDMLHENETTWAYFMTWSKEFLIGEQYNTVEELRKVYASSYAVTEKVEK